MVGSDIARVNVIGKRNFGNSGVEPCTGGYIENIAAATRGSCGQPNLLYRRLASRLDSLDGLHTGRNVEPIGRFDLQGRRDE